MGIGYFSLQQRQSRLLLYICGVFYANIADKHYWLVKIPINKWTHITYTDYAHPDGDTIHSCYGIYVTDVGCIMVIDVAARYTGNVVHISAVLHVITSYSETCL